MSQISNDAEFKQTLQGLEQAQQRVVAAMFVEHVLPLSTDERIARVTRVAADKNASAGELLDALRTAKAATMDSHTRCGSEGNWTEQAGYFVSRAAMAALTPCEQCTSGSPAWQAAMSSRMAQTSMLIDSEDAIPVGNEWQYDILSNYLNS
jgi:hypothetical protein